MAVGELQHLSVRARGRGSWVGRRAASPHPCPHLPSQPASNVRPPHPLLRFVQQPSHLGRTLGWPTPTHPPAPGRSCASSQAAAGGSVQQQAGVRTMGRFSGSGTSSAGGRGGGIGSSGAAATAGPAAECHQQQQQQQHSSSSSSGRAPHLRVGHLEFWPVPPDAHLQALLAGHQRYHQPAAQLLRQFDELRGGRVGGQGGGGVGWQVGGGQSKAAVARAHPLPLPKLEPAALALAHPSSPPLLQPPTHLGNFFPKPLLAVGQQVGAWGRGSWAGAG